jgi:hypothetical protein
VSTITRTAPRVEGGNAVAPSTFGRFAGDLIAPSETTGQIFAITPRGDSELVANSGLPHGNDIGVESAGFVPKEANADAFLADRLTPGNPHPGDDVILRIGAAALRNAGVRPSDLPVSTEGGALTDNVTHRGPATPFVSSRKVRRSPTARATSPSRRRSEWARCSGGPSQTPDEDPGQPSIARGLAQERRSNRPATNTLSS